MPRHRPPPPKPERRNWHAGTIREVRPGVWRAWRSRERRPDGTSTRPSRTFATRAAAEAWAANAPLPDQLYLGQWLEQWLALRRPTLRSSTLAIYRRHVDACGSLLVRPLAALTSDDWQIQTNALLGRWSRYHVRVWRGNLSTALRAAMPRYLTDNPLSRVRLPTPDDVPPRAWRQDEIGRLLAAGSGRLHEAWLWFALATGVRIGEARALAWADVDMQARTATIRHSAHNVTGVLGPTKTGKTRTVDLPDELVPVLVAHRAHQAPGARYVFGAGRQPVSAGALRSWLRGCCTRAKITQHPPHALRHTAASLLLDAGIPVTEVAYMLGHSTPAITLRVYASFIRADGRRAAAALGRVLVPGAETPVSIRAEG